MKLITVITKQLGCMCLFVCVVISRFKLSLASILLKTFLFTIFFKTKDYFEN